MTRSITTKLLILLLLESASASAQLPSPLQISTGLIAGEPASSTDVMVYRGIPYAAPPIGDNRWRAPQEPAGWAGVRPALEFGPRCVQRGFAVGASQPLTSEDCLYLNVWTPAKAQNELQPVMLWIHGGGFFSGAGSDTIYDAQHLAAKGAVVVTMNYRLGSFGFFSHPELTAESPNHSSGNYALLDMVAALEWVYDNIAAFGGDPTNVTVFGESAGAIAIGSLITSPLSQGLIHRAILQSRADTPELGYTSRPQRTLAQAEAAGMQQMRDFGAASLADLRAASSQEIFENFPSGGDVIVDGWYLPKSMQQTIADGEQHLVYVMAGTNRDEANFFGPGFQSLAEYRDYAQTEFGDMAQEFLTLYPARNDAEANAQGKQAFNDEMAFLARKLVGAQADWGFESFVYFFTRVPPGAAARGATHVSELAYVFNQFDQHPEWTEADRLLADTMASYWTNFARRSTPNGQGIPAWPAFTGNTPGNAQVLGEVVTTEARMVPSADKLDFFSRAYDASME